jgi:hypothetical protein
VSVEIFETFDRRALAALQARDVPRVWAADYFTLKEDADAEDARALARWDDYLAGFAKLTDAKCLCCGTSLRCVFGLGFFGGFEWGQAHGEGHCSTCHYPMRGYHRVDGLGTIPNLFLPYHPSEFAFTAKEES